MTDARYILREKAPDTAHRYMSLLVDQFLCHLWVRRRLCMANKNRLKRAAVKIGTAVGRADSRAHQAAHKVAKAAKAAEKELNALGKQVDALKRQLQKSTKRLRRALR